MPSTHIKNKQIGGASHVCNPSAGKAEIGGSMRLSDRSSESVSSGSVKDPITKQSWRETEEDIWPWLLASVCMHRHAHMYTHVYLNMDIPTDTYSLFPCTKTIKNNNKPWFWWITQCFQYFFYIPIDWKYLGVIILTWLSI